MAHPARRRCCYRTNPNLSPHPHPHPHPPSPNPKPNPKHNQALLLAHGAHPSPPISDAHPFSAVAPLHLVAATRPLDQVAVTLGTQLLEAGADPDQVDEHGLAPLMLLARADPPQG